MSSVLGFSIKEQMIGWHTTIKSDWSDDNWKPMKFNAVWGTKNTLEALKTGRFLLTGDVTIDGLCKKVPMCGWLYLNYLYDCTLKYTFSFTVKGVPYTFVGRKVNIQPWNLLTSHTTCTGTIYDCNGKIYSHSITFFRLRDILSFLLSLRFTISSVGAAK